MLLIYTPRITQRKRYIFDLMIYQLCGFEYDITDNLEQFLNFKGAKINYSSLPVSDDEFFIFSNGFLNEKGVKPHTPKPFLIYDDIYAIFPTSHPKSRLSFDVFSAAFYFVSRYEEYLPHQKDLLGRFEADQSLAYQNGFLEKPVVNHYSLYLSKLLKKNFSFLKVSKINTFKFIPTYDIDVAYAYKGKGFFRTIGGYGKSIINLDINSIKQRTQVLTGKRPDPFDTYSFQLELLKRTGIVPYFFFLVADYGIKDKNPSIYNLAYQKLIKMIGDYAETGIHTSFASNQYPGKVKEEVSRLSSLLNREIKHCRQHYLMLELPHTYHRLMQAGITNDYTMGFASHIGFRAGICSPFLFYDLQNEAMTNIIVNPLSVMDAALKYYMKLGIHEGIERVKNLADEVQYVNGTFITLWHNESLSDCNQWRGWKDMYLDIYKYAADKMFIKLK